MRALDKAEVTALFESESVFVGTEDCVPKHRAVALFGEDAVKHVLGLTGGTYYNFYGPCECMLCILTFKGFLAAASFRNVRLMIEEGKLQTAENCRHKNGGKSRT